MRLVRSRAAEWGIDPKRVGIMGFSAGGEVASMVAYGHGAGDSNASDPIDRLDAHPDFQILIYPGPLGIPEVIPQDAPPAFLLVANDDRGAARVIANLFQKYRDSGRTVEAHIFASGGHGIQHGKSVQARNREKMAQRLADWMNDSGILDPSRKP